MKEEALKLADELGKNIGGAGNVYQQASAMIRRLVEELDKPHKYDPETGEPLIDGYPLFSGLPRGKPLSDEEILNIWLPFATDGIKGKIEFARAIEERHGIK